MKVLNIDRIFLLMIFFVLSLAGTTTVSAQNNDKTFSEIEKSQDKIEDLYVEVYRIAEKYPEMTYSYVYEDGDATAVKIEGIDDNREKKQLEVYLLDIEDIKSDIYNRSNRTGVYYVAEEEPEPEAGYKTFYNTVQSNLGYPDEAENAGIEGTVFVKFIVNAEGEISAATAAEDLETSRSYLVDDMKKEAVEAVKATSGNWEPATVGGIPVSHYMVIPVQFKIEPPFYGPIY